MKKWFTRGGMGILSLALVLNAWAAGFTTSKDKMTIVVDQAFQLQKPDKKWDTQQVKKVPNTPVQLVWNQLGRDPTIQLKYEPFIGALKGKRLGSFAEYLKKDYRLQGVLIEEIEKTKINGQKVALLHGVNPNKNERYLIGVWVTKEKGYIVECSSALNDFQAMKSHFNKVIDTARLIK